MEKAFIDPTRIRAESTPVTVWFRIESERLKLPAPFSRRIAEPFDADAPIGILPPIKREALTMKVEWPAFTRWRHLRVLAVAAANLFSRGDEGGPDRGRGSLGDRLELEGRPALGRQLGVDPRHGRLEFAGLQMAAELGHDSARVQ